ncbi:MAG: DUF6446 family protein [Pseudomonadota bacterium]
MNKGQIAILGLGAVSLALGGVLYWTANHAWYERVTDVTEITVRGQTVSVTGYDGIDSPTSPLRIRGCFRLDVADLPAMEPAPEATPLIEPPWFECFDAGQLTADLASGAATAHAIADETPVAERDGDFAIIRYIAVYPDGRAYLWRQRNEV